jgi:hypothetical protein
VAERVPREVGPEGAPPAPERANAPPAQAGAAFVLAAQQAYGNAVVARAMAARQPADGGAPAAADGGAAAGLIVADDAEPGPGQMARGQFLAQLRDAAAAAARDVLGTSPMALAVGPGVERWMAPYQGRDAAGLEQAIREKAPAAAGASSASALIDAVSAAVREAVGEGVTDDPGASGDAATDLDEDERPQIPSELLAEVSGIAAILFKREEVATSRSADPRSVLRRLGAGRPLGDVERGRMEPLVGRDLGDVRVHAGAAGARVSSELGARAFAVGQDVAFGAGQYRPGTVVGDALLAHELAHVGQQDAGALGDERALEQDADETAAGAVAALWHGDRSVQRRPRLRDALALRSCNSGAAKSTRVHEPIPRDPRKVYEQKLPEGVNKLKVGFGRADVNARYDRNFWDIEIDERTGESCLALNKGKLPSDAIDAMFADLSKWSLDCAQFVQIAHLYALRWAYGNDEFDRKVGGVNFKFKPHYSDGLDKSTYWNREGPGQKMTRYVNTNPAVASKADPQPDDRSPQEILDAAPVGARVMWTNLDAPSGSAFRNENTVKLGNGLFAAQGFGRAGNTYSGDEIAQKLADITSAEKPAPRDYVQSKVYLKQIETYDTVAGLPAAPP